MSWSLKLFLFATFCTGTSLVGNPGAVVPVQNEHGTMFTGTFIRPRVLVTVRHGLSNEIDGGVILEDGTRSIRVSVPDGPRNPEQDIAFVLFASDIAPAIAKVNSGRGTLVKGDTLTVVSRRNGGGINGREDLLRLQGAYLVTTYTEGWRRGDSGSALFARGGGYIGPMRGCTPKTEIVHECAFYMLTGPVGMNAYRKASRELREGFRNG